MKNRLKLLRVERNWTQEQLGQALGVSRQAVNALETEKHDPSLDLAYRIAALFERPVEDIFENPHVRRVKSGKPYFIISRFTVILGLDPRIEPRCARHVARVAQADNAILGSSPRMTGRGERSVKRQHTKEEP